MAVQIVERGDNVPRNPATLEASVVFQIFLLWVTRKTVVKIVAKICIKKIIVKLRLWLTNTFSFLFLQLNGF